MADNSVFRNGAGKPIVAIDIDGTLADYHGWFLKFSELYFGRDMPDPRAINPGRPLWVHMGISQQEYRECKLAYRQGGMKRSMPVYSGAETLCGEIRAVGAEVWICTTRPYLRLDNIDPDTREWLRRNSIEYDAVLFGKDKYQELVRQVGLDRIVAIIDDLPEYIQQASDAGISKIYLRDQPYNKKMVFPGLPITRIDDCYWLGTLIREDIDRWKEQHG